MLDQLPKCRKPGAAGMNSFRTFKLKLPKRVDDGNQTDWADEETVHPSKQVDDYAVQGPSRSAVPSPPVPAESFLLEASKHKQDQLSLKTETHNFNCQTIPPISSCLPQIDKPSDYPRQGKEASVLLQPEYVSSKLRFPVQFPQLPVISPDSCADAVAVNSSHRPIDPGQRCKDPRKQSEVALQNSANFPSPKPSVLKAPRLAGHSSFPSSDSKLSSKCSSSPTSADSAYPRSSDQNATASEPKVDEHSEVDKREGCYKCSFCRRTFSYLCHLKVHERVHTGEKPYSCKFCSQQFSQLGSLTVHMRIHTGAKPYQCGKCSKKFRHVNSLRRHQRQVHNLTSKQIAASLDKCKEKSSASTGMRLGPKHHASRQYLIKRKMAGYTHQSFNANTVYRQHILHSYNEHRLSLPEDKQTEMHTFLQSSTAHDPRSPAHHKSKIICEIEGRLEREAVSISGTETPCGVDSQTATSNLNSRKPAPKTWRPFSTDEDKVSTHQVTSDNNQGRNLFHTNKLDQSQSTNSPPLTSIGAVKVENQETDGNSRLYSYQKPGYGHAYYCGNLLAQQKIMKPSWWLSPLSLRASCKPQPLFAVRKKSAKKKIRKRNANSDSRASSKAQPPHYSCKVNDKTKSSKSNIKCDFRANFKAQKAFDSPKENDKTEPTKTEANCDLRNSFKTQPAFDSSKEKDAAGTSKININSASTESFKAEPAFDSRKENERIETTKSNINSVPKGESEDHPEDTGKHSATEIEKGEHSSDEGFSSACSTEDARSPHASLDVLQGSEEPLNIQTGDASLQVQKNPG